MPKPQPAPLTVRVAITQKRPEVHGIIELIDRELEMVAAALSGSTMTYTRPPSAVTQEIDLEEAAMDAFHLQWEPTLPLR